MNKELQKIFDEITIGTISASDAHMKIFEIKQYNHFDETEARKLVHAFRSFTWKMIYLQFTEEYLRDWIDVMHRQAIRCDDKIHQAKIYQLADMLYESLAYGCMISHGLTWKTLDKTRVFNERYSQIHSNL